MDDLKPCPFCGNRQVVHREFGGLVLNTTSHKRNCIMRKLLSFGMGGGLVFDTKAEAIEAWNTRAERTCENVAPSYLDFLCSKCGFVHYHSDENDSGSGNEWSHCPSSGAKVVSA